MNCPIRVGMVFGKLTNRVKVTRQDSITLVTNSVFLSKNNDIRTFLNKNYSQPTTLVIDHNLLTALFTTSI